MHYITKKPHFKCTCVSEVGQRQFSVFALAFAVPCLLDVAWEEAQPGFQTLLSSASFFEFCSRSKLFFTLVVETFEILIAESSRSSHGL